MSELHNQIAELVKLHAQQLGEHVDTVQIFVSRQSDGGETTVSFDFGTGNLFARIGHVQQWVIWQHEYAREHARTTQRRDLEE